MTNREQTLDRIKTVRAQALDHARQARALSQERAQLIRTLLDDGMSQADVARELGVTRQAIQKMLTTI